MMLASAVTACRSVRLPFRCPDTKRLCRAVCKRSCPPVSAVVHRSFKLLHTKKEWLFISPMFQLKPDSSIRRRRQRTTRAVRRTATRRWRRWSGPRWATVLPRPLPAAVVLVHRPIVVSGRRAPKRFRPGRQPMPTLQPRLMMGPTMNVRKIHFLIFFLQQFSGFRYFGQLIRHAESLHGHGQWVPNHTGQAAARIPPGPGGHWSGGDWARRAGCPAGVGDDLCSASHDQHAQRQCVARLCNYSSASSDRASGSTGCANFSQGLKLI